MRLEDDEKSMISIHTLKGFQNVLAVNEPGLYRLIMRLDGEVDKSLRYRYFRFELFEKSERGKIGVFTKGFSRVPSPTSSLRSFPDAR